MVQYTLIPNTNVIQRILAIKFRDNFGTGFTVKFNDRFFLVSAKHIFTGIGSPDTIEILRNNAWIPLEVYPHFIDEGIDIIVFPLNQQITPDFEVILDGKGCCYGQEVYFFGFPDFIFLNKLEHIILEYSEINNGFPLPLVNKGVISTLNKKPLVLIAGIGTKGFSGGPIIYENLETHVFHIIGIMSEYMYSPKYIDEGEHNEEWTEIISENSGFFVGYHIDCAIDIIKKIY